MKYAFIFILFVGFIIRLILIGNSGFIADISFWKSWSMAAVDHGIVWTTQNTNINYPPGFIYMLWLMGKVYSIISNPHDYYTFWRENNFAFLFVSKSIAIFSDIVIATLIYWFFSQKEKLKKLGATLTINHLPLILATVFYLNPVVIIDSALWGQVESFGILFTLVAIILLFYRRPFLATAIFTIGTLMKLQNIIYIPLYLLFIYRYFDIKTLAKALGVSAAVFFIVNIPFILASEMKQVLYLMTVNSDYFPFLSLNAHNLWWIVGKADAMKISDKITVLGILNAKSVGLLLFSCSYLISTILLYKKPTPRNFILSLVFAIYAFFIFTTESHERYSYPVIVLLLFFYPFLTDKAKTQNNTRSMRMHSPGVKELVSNWSKLKYNFAPIQKYFWIIYVLFTISIFFNIHFGLVVNYPQNGINALTAITTSKLTILNSYITIFLFFLLLPFLFSQVSIIYLILSLFLAGACLFFPNIPYLTSGKVSLTSFKPIIRREGYGKTQLNRAVKSYTGWKDWSWLAVDYFYYRKGFGTHAYSNLVFDINKKFSKFATDYGVDYNAPTKASVIFKIYGDGKELFSSSKMGRFDLPKHLEINVPGVKFLGLVVEDAGDGINSDHADWLNPILYR